MATYFYVYYSQVDRDEDIKRWVVDELPTGIIRELLGTISGLKELTFRDGTGKHGKFYADEPANLRLLIEYIVLAIPENQTRPDYYDDIIN